jgi:gliding motility-associated lipoprotein GldD
MRVILLPFIILLFASCQDEVLIKPKAQLRLTYPIANYEEVRIGLPYHFKKNKEAVLKEKRNNALNLYYPAMKATFYLTYQKVDKNKSGKYFRTTLCK